MEARMNPTHEARRVSPRLRTIQPAWVRITHWLNALAAILMMLSGWRIYDASPVFKGFVIPPGITLGGWLGGALQWHFAAMWLLFFNGLFLSRDERCYRAHQVASFFRSRRGQFCMTWARR
jgi:thiosulfate reductase cytochrome b subunit